MARVLIIDDQPEMRNIMRRSLELVGHEVVEARDGTDGVAQYRRTSADIVVTDILMPDSDGIELITSLRRVDPQVRILAISGGGSAGRVDFLRMATTLGAKSTLNKPFSPAQLQARVAELLAR